MGELSTWKLTLSRPHPQSESLVIWGLCWLCLLSFSKSRPTSICSPIDRKCSVQILSRSLRTKEAIAREKIGACVSNVSDGGTVGVIFGGCKFVSCCFFKPDTSFGRIHRSLPQFRHGSVGCLRSFCTGLSLAITRNTAVSGGWAFEGDISGGLSFLLDIGSVCVRGSEWASGGGGGGCWSMAGEFDLQQQHGKARVRVARLWRGRSPGEQHRIVEWNVSISITSHALPAFTDGDNSSIVATDSIKNTVRRCSGSPRRLLSCTRLLASYWFTLSFSFCFFFLLCYIPVSCEFVWPEIHLEFSSMESLGPPLQSASSRKFCYWFRTLQLGLNVVQYRVPKIYSASPPLEGCGLNEIERVLCLCIWNHSLRNS